MKNLANCSPKEFMAQTFKIKKCVEKWIKDTKILDIRKNLPKVKPIDDLDGEEREKAIAENKEIVKKQVMKNMMDMLDGILSEHAEETIELLALCCFIDPKDAENHSMSEYLECIGELMSDKGVLNFFTSLAQLDATNM